MKVIKSVDYTPRTFNPSGPPSLQFSDTLSVSTNGTRFNKSGVLVAATSNVPRIDYNPNNLYNAPRVLLEPSKINYCLRTETFNHADWGKVGSLTATDNINTSPRNTTTGCTLTDSDNTNPTLITQTTTLSLIVGDTYTSSLFIRKDSFNSCTLNSYINGGVENNTTFTFLSGTELSASNSNSNDYGWVYIANGWFRIWQKNVADLNNVVIWRFWPEDRSVQASLGTIFIFGAQLETGSLSSYIPNTTSVTVTRTADTFNNNIYTNIAQPSGDDPALWSASTVYLNSSISDEAIGTSYSTTTQVKRFDSLTPSWDIGSALITISVASPCVVTWTAHGIPADTPIQFTNISGSLPTGLSFGTVYYVKSPLTNSFNLSATVGGAAINTSGSAATNSFIVVASTNYNKQPETNPTYWLETLSTNRARMFDGFIGTADDTDSGLPGSATRATTAEGIAILRSLPNTAGINSSFLTDVCLFNINCTSARVVAYTGYYTSNPTVIYDNIVSGDDDCGILDLYAYLTEEITRISNINFTDIPPYNDTVISLCLHVYDSTNETVSCGECLFGVAKEFGALQANARLGVSDYTLKSFDSFGNPTIVERGYSDKNDYTVWIESNKTSSIKKLLNSYRAIPLVWVGEQTKQFTYSFGYYKDFSIILSYPTVDICNLEIESLS